MKNYKIGIVDDHILFAEGTSNIITHLPKYKLCFIATTAQKLFVELETQLVDFLLLDINLPKVNGLEILKLLRKDYPSIKVMLLSMYQPSDIGLTTNALEADAYVLKISGKEILLEALQALENDSTYLDPNIIKTSHVEDKFTNQLKLTKREKEIIDLVFKGKTSKEIADQLFVSELTIKTHRKNIHEKLGTKNIGSLINKNGATI